jgi:hypothetical protein
MTVAVAALARLRRLGLDAGVDMVFIYGLDVQMHILGFANELRRLGPERRSTTISKLASRGA